MNGQVYKKAYRLLKTLKFNPNLLIFGFFFMVAAVFWFFNALNREYYTDILVPVKFINLPENKLQVGNPQNFLKLKISAYGYQVMDYKASTLKPIVIDFKQVQAIPDTKNKKYFILSSTLNDNLSAILGPNFKIHTISPDSIILDLVKVISKKVPVKRNFNIGFKKQFMLKDSIRFVPDSVKIKGIESILDTIKAVNTQNKSFKEIKDSLWFDIELQKISGTEIFPEMVSCLVPVEEYTEMEFKLPVYVLNEPIGYSVKLFPSEAKVIFNVGFSRYKKISDDQFRLVADYFEIDKTTNARVIIKMVKFPENISNVRIFPQSLDFIIEKND